MKVSNRWISTANGGLICRTGRNTYLARPDCCGMNSVQYFTNETDARTYAESIIR